MGKSYIIYYDCDLIYNQRHLLVKLVTAYYKLQVRPFPLAQLSKEVQVIKEIIKSTRAMSYKLLLLYNCPNCCYEQWFSARDSTRKYN